MKFFHFHYFGDFLFLLNFTALVWYCSPTLLSLGTPLALTPYHNRFQVNVCTEAGMTKWGNAPFAICRGYQLWGAHHRSPGYQCRSLGPGTDTSGLPKLPSVRDIYFLFSSTRSLGNYTEKFRKLHVKYISDNNAGFF